MRSRARFSAWHRRVVRGAIGASFVALLMAGLIWSSPGHAQSLEDCLAAAEPPSTDWPSALAPCREATVDPGISDLDRQKATRYYAAALLITGRGREALAVAERGVKRWPREPSLLFTLARSAQTVGEYEKALEAGQKLLDQGAGISWRTVFMVAEVLTKLERFDEAEKALEQAEWSGVDADLAGDLRAEILRGRAIAGGTSPHLQPLDAPFVTVANANIRLAPKVSAQLVTTLARGTQIRTVGKVKGGDWYLIARDGKELGYVFGPLVAPANSQQAIAAVERLAPAAVPAKNAPARPARPASVPENRHAVAVIIGNRRYGGDVPEVSYAHNDADAMKKTLPFTQRS